MVDHMLFSQSQRLAAEVLAGVPFEGIHNGRVIRIVATEVAVDALEEIQACVPSAEERLGYGRIDRVLLDIQIEMLGALPIDGVLGVYALSQLACVGLFGIFVEQEVAFAVPAIVFEVGDQGPSAHSGQLAAASRSPAILQSDRSPVDI